MEPDKCLPPSPLLVKKHSSPTVWLVCSMAIALIFRDIAGLAATSGTLHWNGLPLWRLFLLMARQYIQEILSIDYLHDDSQDDEVAWESGTLTYMIWCYKTQFADWRERNKQTRNKQANKQTERTYSDSCIQCASFWINMRQYIPAHRSTTKWWRCVSLIDAHRRKISLKQHEAVSHLAAWLSLISVYIFVYFRRNVLDLFDFFGWYYGSVPPTFIGYVWLSA